MKMDVTKSGEVINKDICPPIALVDEPSFEQSIEAMLSKDKLVYRDTFTRSGSFLNRETKNKEVLEDKVAQHSNISVFNKKVKPNISFIVVIFSSTLPVILSQDTKKSSKPNTIIWNWNQKSLKWVFSKVYGNKGDK